jgi:ankyrin repeat protein
MKEKTKEELLISLQEEYSKGTLSLQDLLNRDYNIRFCNNSGDNILHFACNNRKINDIESIINTKSIDINSTNKYGTTPLFSACSYGSTKITSLLLQNGANPNSKNHAGETPFFQTQAIPFLTPENIKIYNIDLNSTNFNNISLFATIINKGYYEIFLNIANDPDLSQYINWGQLDNQGNNLIHYLTNNVLDPNEETISQTLNILIRYNIDINQLNFSGNSPLKHLVHTQNKSMLSVMHHANANFNNIDSENHSFLFFILEQIINTDQAIKTNNYHSIIDQERLSKFVIIKSYLESHNLDYINNTDLIDTITNMIKNSDINKIKDLYKSHIAISPAKINILNQGLLACLNRSHPKVQISNFLLKQGANINDPLFSNTFTNALLHSTTIAEYMIQHNYNINQDIYGDNLDNALTFYFKTTNIGYKSILQLLLAAGADINHQNKDGDTFAHILMQKNNRLTDIFDILNLSLQNGLSITIPNQDNKTVYQMYVDFDITKNNATTSYNKIQPIIEKHYLEESLHIKEEHHVKKLKI